MNAKTQRTGKKRSAVLFVMMTLVLSSFILASVFSDGNEELSAATGTVNANDSYVLKYDTINGDNEARITGIDTTGTGTILAIPDYVGPGTTLPITAIGNSAFNAPNNLSTITIPNGVTSLGNYAFFDCTGLTSVIFEAVSVLETIGISAFYGCASLSTITIPSSVKSIDSSAFSRCTGLQEINVDNNNTHFKDIDGVLYSKDGRSLITYPIGKSGTSYTIVEDVTSIGSYAFYGCDGLSSITIPNSVTSVSSYAFYGCTDLTSVVFEASSDIETIGNGAFYGCTSLTSITIPGSVTTIGNNAFRDCTGLLSITIPNSVTAIGNAAFYDCRVLGTLVAPESLVLTSAAVPTATKIIRYSGATAVTASIDSDKVTLNFVAPAGKQVEVKVGTAAGANDVTVTGSGTTWSFDASGGNEFFMTTTVSDIPDDSNLLLYIAIAAIIAVIALAAVYFVFIRKP